MQHNNRDLNTVTSGVIGVSVQSDTRYSLFALGLCLLLLGSQILAGCEPLQMPVCYVCKNSTQCMQDDVCYKDREQMYGICIPRGMCYCLPEQGELCAAEICGVERCYHPRDQFAGYCASSKQGECTTERGCPPGWTCQRSPTDPNDPGRCVYTYVCLPCQTGDRRPCYTGDPRTKDVGNCKTGYRECLDGKWQVCRFQVLPEPEICDGQFDENCDGLIDENCVSVLAGTGQAGSDDGSSTEATFQHPVALAYSSKSTNVLYIADTSNNQIRSLELHEQRGEVKRAAGEGRAAYKDGVAWGAIFNQPKGMVMDNSQRLYIADSANHKIRIFDTHFGQVSTLCPQIGLQSPSDVTIDTVGYLYIADTGNHRIVKLETSASCTYTVLAGSGKAGKQDGIGKEAGFHSPQALSLRDGYLYVADTGNHIIRKIDPDDRVSTIAGSGKRGSSDGQGLSAQFNAPQGIAVDSEHNIYVADTDNHSIRKIDINGHVSTLAGSQSIGSANASGSQAQFFHPSGLLLAHNQTTLYIADRGNHQLRKMLIPYLNKSK